MVYKNFAFSTPFLRGYRELKIPIISADGTPTWPELFPPSRIDELRDSVGARYFSAQMMLEYIAPDRARLDPDALHIYSDEFDVTTARIGTAQITGATIYWDPSSGHKKSDNSVCVLLYRDDKNRCAFIHDVKYLIVPDEELHPLARQCEMVIDFMMRARLRRISIETNGIGNALPEIMRDVSSRQNISISINRVTNHKKKETRILDSIEPILTAGRLYAHVRVQSTPLLAEMLGWTPIGGTTHDDGLDAVAGALCATPTPIHPLSRGMPTFSANTEFKI